LTLGVMFNKNTARLKLCDNYTVIKKQYRERGFRTGEAYFLYVRIDGKTKKINSKKITWDNMKVGNSVEICIYDSLIGLDYIELTNNN